jgi:hypothetical protein
LHSPLSQLELKRNQTIAHCLWRSDAEEADQRLPLCYEQLTCRAAKSRDERAPPHLPPPAKDHDTINLR